MLWLRKTRCIIASLSLATILIVVFVQLFYKNVGQPIPQNSFRNFIPVYHEPQDVLQTRDQNHDVCKPETKIIFLKTHKTGSTTLSHILQRYGLGQNLKFVKSAKSCCTISDYEKFHRKLIKNGWRQTFDICCDHAIYNRAEMDKVIPDAKYITIMRHPVEQFVSGCDYFSWSHALHLENFTMPLEELMNAPESYLGKKDYRAWMLSKNPMMYHLGVDGKHPDAVERAVEIADNEFHLVLITEYFDESMILMKKLLCLSYEDILYSRMRVHAGQQRSCTKGFPITDELKDKIASWNDADMKFYDHVNKSFWWKVKEYGPDFGVHLSEFRKLLAHTSDDCNRTASKLCTNLNMLFGQQISLIGRGAYLHADTKVVDG